jgi:hypothetical protein
VVPIEELAGADARHAASKLAALGFSEQFTLYFGRHRPLSLFFIPENEELV